ncbi:arylamine N-acetyltransferase [Pyrenophora seminiperda CCB06]|uniref:Arylamine N-acetyltransferase n=1 Tax=Pyrenophora seminiperda CCB06 TaxID=1302712 RepID=A0A3M7M471_9PLEO|nr:arylamine N-acetyltransferase [Pyrenophora seminiperda CCB06]
MLPTPEPSTLPQLPLNDADRPRYSTAQIRDYFRRLSLPQKYLNSPVLSDKTAATTIEHGLPFLQALTRYHACTIPFENLELHYSAHKTISLNVSDLYTQLVTKRRGGRCMENNTFFATVLRSLGYQVRNCGGRVSRSQSPYSEVRRNQASTYDGWNHMLNLVRLDNAWYVVDVGMGSMGPNMPYPLQDGFETTSIAPRKIRLQSRAIPESYGYHSNKLWCYDVCYDPVDDDHDDSGAKNTWTPVYCFTETEFLPQDYEMMSWFTSTHPRSFFTRHVTCTKMIMDEEQEKIVGHVLLFGGEVKESIGSERRVLEDCKTEEKRVEVLKSVFDVELTEEERMGIPEERRLG